MRRLTIKVKEGQGKEVLKKAEELGGKNLSLVQVHLGELVHVHLNNQQVSKFMESIKGYSDAEINLIPRGIIAMYPPQEDAPDQVTDVTYRSPIEIYLGGIQSVGSWFGLLGYSLAGGILAWIGLYTNTSYLLVAAMLVAPFAGPAMNAAIGAASGKGELLKRSLIRYFMAIGAAVLVSFLLSFILNLSYATPMMTSVSQISQVSLLLPLVAGFAGGINLVQSERDSLVSGAAVGMLVAASLAPPTALIGMALSIGNWQIVQSGVFLLVLQLAGIQLSAALVFRYLGGVTTKGVRFADGGRNVFKFTLIVSILVVGGMLFWQFYERPSLQKSSLNTLITETMKTDLQELSDVEAIDVNARFTRGTLPNLNPVICELYLLNRNDSLTDEQVKELVTERLYERIKDKYPNADPMFSVNMLKRSGDK